MNLARHQSERDALGAVGELVHRSVERPIAVVIARDGFADPITIVVTPRRWDGRGLLGSVRLFVQVMLRTLNFFSDVTFSPSFRSMLLSKVLGF